MMPSSSALVYGEDVDQAHFQIQRLIALACGKNGENIDPHTILVHGVFMEFEITTAENIHDLFGTASGRDAMRYIFTSFVTSLALLSNSIAGVVFGPPLQNVAHEVSWLSTFVLTLFAVSFIPALINTALARGVRNLLPVYNLGSLPVPGASPVASLVFSSLVMMQFGASLAVDMLNESITIQYDSPTWNTYGKAAASFFSACLYNLGALTFLSVHRAQANHNGHSVILQPWLSSGDSTKLRSHLLHLTSRKAAFARYCSLFFRGLIVETPANIASVVLNPRTISSIVVLIPAVAANTMMLKAKSAGGVTGWSMRAALLLNLGVAAQGPLDWVLKNRIFTQNTEEAAFEFGAATQRKLELIFGSLLR